MGSRLTSLVLIALLALGGSSAHAASKSPTPKVKVSTKATATAKAKVTAKATVKATAQPSVKATAKTTAKPSVTKKATAKPTPKPTKKKVIKKKKKRAKVRVTSSPKPMWPPTGFSVEGEVYAKIPTGSEFVSITSDDTKLEMRLIVKKLPQCKEVLCGRLQMGSEIGCVWWEVISDVVDGQGAILGTLNTALKGSNPKEVKTVLLISPESVAKGGDVIARSVICHHEDRVTNDPSNNYKKVTS